MSYFSWQWVIHPLTLFSNLADLLVGVTARSIDLRLRLGDWAFPRVGVSALDFAGEALFVRAGERVFLSAEAGDFGTFLLRLRERLLDLLLDVDLEVDLLPCEIKRMVNIKFYILETHCIYLCMG